MYGDYFRLRAAFGEQQRHRGRASEVELAEINDNQTGSMPSNASHRLVSMRRDLDLLKRQFRSELGQGGSEDTATTGCLEATGSLEGDAVPGSSHPDTRPLAVVMRIELSDLRFDKALDGSLQCLGAGGQGKVYAATLNATFPVAVKVLPHNGGDLALVMREAEVLFKCSHPNVLQVWGEGSLCLKGLGGDAP